MSSPSENPPTQKYLDFPAIQTLCVFFKLHPDGEIQIIVAERAVGFRLEVITVLSDDLRLSQTLCDLAGGKINICWQREWGRL